MFGRLGQDTLPQGGAYPAALHYKIHFPSQEFRGEGSHVASGLVARHFPGFVKGCVTNGRMTLAGEFAGRLSHERGVQPGKEPVEEAF